MEELQLIDKNQEFLTSVSESFRTYLIKGTSRSNDKLKPVHSRIARDLAELLGNGYSVHSLGYGNGKEKEIEGRYMDKKVDIAIFKGEQPVAGIGVKFVMRNYSQNSVNYFENMLGETANIRCNKVPYFQVFITFDHIPYFNSEKELKRWEVPTAHNLEKYIRLSNDNTTVYFHTPDKTLLAIFHIPEPTEQVNNNEDYLSYYRKNLPEVTQSEIELSGLGSNVILNDYESFINKIKMLVEYNA